MNLEYRFPLLFDENGQVISDQTFRGLDKVTRPLLYISGPMYSEGNLVDNVRVAIHYAREAYAKGWAPILPQLDFLVRMVTGESDRERYMDVDLAQIRGCVAVMVLPYTKEVDDAGNITGTSEELTFAESVLVPIYTPSTLPYVQ